MHREKRKRKGKAGALIPIVESRPRLWWTRQAHTAAGYGGKTRVAFMMKKLVYCIHKIYINKPIFIDLK